MKNTYKENRSALTALFINSYFEEYKKLKKKNKSLLLAHIQTNYRKWFYSSFLEETILTPHTIVDKMNEGNMDSFIMPALRYNSLSKEGFYFTDVTYTLDDHPMARDLRTFISMCVPELDLTESDSIPPDTLERFANEMSIQDPLYAEYLFELSVHMKLLTKIPSIYANKCQITDAASALKDLPPRELLDKIFNAVIDLAVETFRQSLPEAVSGFTRSYFLSLLKKPQPIDVIFSQVYGSLGFDIAALMEKLEEEADSDNPSRVFTEFNDMIMSGTYMLGVLIDKYFLTPMGFYLHLIMPIYFLPLNFEDELDFLYETLRSVTTLDTGLWSPCSSFFLTDLGLKYLKVKKTKNNYVRLPNTMPMSELILNVELAVKSEKQTKLKQKSTLPAKTIYEIKAKLRTNKNIWFSFEIEEDSTLDDINEMICDMFILDFDADYSITVGDNPSPFTTYVSSVSSSRYKAAASVPLSDLNLTPKQKLCYNMPNTFSSNPWAYSFVDKNLYVDMEVTAIKRSNPRVYYPLVTRKGKYLEQFEDEAEF